MTRKDYQRIAEAIRFHLDMANSTGEREAEGRLYGVIADLAETFEKDNPRFDREKFKQACGIV